MRKKNISQWARKNFCSYRTISVCNLPIMLRCHLMYLLVYDISYIFLYFSSSSSMSLDHHRSLSSPSPPRCLLSGMSYTLSNFRYVSALIWCWNCVRNKTCKRRSVFKSSYWVPQRESNPWSSRIPVGCSSHWAMGDSWWARSQNRFFCVTHVLPHCNFGLNTSKR